MNISTVCRSLKDIDIKVSFEAKIYIEFDIKKGQG